jgi:hypothetical protein
MEHIIAKLVHDLDQGKLTRRQRIEGLAFVATAASAVGASP